MNCGLLHSVALLNLYHPRILGKELCLEVSITIIMPQKPPTKGKCGLLCLVEESTRNLYIAPHRPIHACSLLIQYCSSSTHASLFLTAYISTFLSLQEGLKKARKKTREEPKKKECNKQTPHRLTSSAVSSTAKPLTT